MAKQLSYNVALWNIFEAHHDYKRQTFPEWATYDGEHRYDDLLTDWSDEAENERQQRWQGFLQDLKSVDYGALSHEDQINYDLFKMMLDEELQMHRFGTRFMAVDQQNGFHIFFPQLVEFQPLDSWEQQTTFLKRLRAFPRQVEQVILNLQRGIEQKITLPRTTMDSTLAQIRQLRDTPLEQNPFWQPVISQGRLLTPAERTQLQQELQQVIAQELTPAYARLYDFVSQEYLPHCHDADGIWILPEGEAYYQFLIEKYTMPHLSADKIHAIGMAEVARIREEMQVVMEKTGFRGSLDEFNQFLKTDPQFYYTDKADLRAGYTQFMVVVDEYLSRFFGRLPISRCEIKEIEEYRAVSAPQAYYYPPPKTRTRPGYFYYNAYDLPSRPQYTMGALTLHEALPGHHLQIAIAQELEHLPEFRAHLDCTAFIEGWALYAESLGHEMGIYDDPYQHYGALSFEMWRACRLVVDTGLHAKRWTRQQAFDFMRAQTPNSDLDIQSEIERYMVMPGQALSYKIGELEIRKLRQHAQEKWGSRFHLKEFHDVVLREGTLPILLLEKEIARWLNEPVGPELEL